jgi:ribosomal protein S18 acetylase RimI-like enzyme
VSPTLRSATAADVPAIAAIYRASSTAREPDEIDDALVAGMVRDASSRGIALVAMEGARLLGFVLGPRHPVRRCAHVMTNVLVCVDAGARGRGVGRALMEGLVAAAHASDWCERIEFYVRASNTVAISLYESLGFVVEGRLRARIDTPQGRVDDLFMALLIPR